MSSQSRKLFHRWVLPHDDLVQRISVGTDKLVVGLGEDKVADLRARVDSIERTQVDGVPEANALVRGASARRKQASVER